MGTCYSVSVVYGIKETPEMRKARNVLAPVEMFDCEEGHVRCRFDPPQFCPKCGQAVGKRLIEVPQVLDPASAYVPPGLDPEDDYDRILNEWVHAHAQDDSAVVLGVNLIHKYSRDDWGSFPIPDPPPEQIQKVNAFFVHLGLDPADARIYLLVGGS